MAILKRWNGTSWVAPDIVATPKIHTHDASDIDSGVLASARIPSLPYLPTGGGTLTGPLTMSGAGDPINLNRIGSRGTEIYIGAGESLSHISGTSEAVYIAGEAGVKVFASSDNLSSGLNRSSTLIDTNGDAKFGGNVYSNSNAKLATESYVNNAIISDTNNYVTGGSGSGDGTLTLNRAGLSDVTIDLSHDHTEFMTSSEVSADYVKQQVEINGKALTGTSITLDHTDVGAMPTSHPANNHTSTHLYMANGDGFIWDDTNNIMSVRRDGTDYRLYHEGHKPTASEVGANPTTGTDSDISTSGGGIIRSLTLTNGVITGFTTDSLSASDVGASSSGHLHTISDITNSGDLAEIDTNGSTSNYLRGDGTWVTPPNTNTWRGIDNTPVNGQTSQSITSNWAYDHENASNPHGISVPVDSVNGQTGAVSLNYNDVGALADHETATDSNKWGGYTIAVNGTDGTGVINFKT